MLKPSSTQRRGHKAELANTKKLPGTAHAAELENKYAAELENTAQKVEILRDVIEVGV